MVAELNEHVAERIGKLARPKRVIWSGDLPKTRSGKIMRRLLRDIAEGRELGDVTTLRDPGGDEELEEKVAARAATRGRLASGARSSTSRSTAISSALELLADAAQLAQGDLLRRGCSCFELRARPRPARGRGSAARSRR